uniref:Uncharacterized protein n=1 Tax=Cannabis sativa TaxID=3483 RepID=A0A803PND2_CANSA
MAMVDQVVSTPIGGLLGIEGTHFDKNTEDQNEATSYHKDQLGKDTNLDAPVFEDDDSKENSSDDVEDDPQETSKDNPQDTPKNFH